VARKFRAFWVAVITGIVVTLASAAIAPAASYEFWTRLVRGDTGLGHSIIYYTNQSVMADIVRVLGPGQEPAIIGLMLSCAVAAAGVWAAALWHRLGDVRLAVNLCGVAGLLASPVSWLHHFVWVVPLAMSLLERRAGSPRSLPWLWAGSLSAGLWWHRSQGSPTEQTSNSSGAGPNTSSPRSAPFLALRYWLVPS
jgi:alpha-1,2-mannosyltransferase